MKVLRKVLWFSIFLGAPVIHAQSENPYACVTETGEMGILVCHIPNGNFKALHDICVGPTALVTHLQQSHSGKKGTPDVLGSCRDAF
jgi:hypothetical protein